MSAQLQNRMALLSALGSDRRIGTATVHTFTMPSFVLLWQDLEMLITSYCSRLQ